jgi:hypothetical protein
MKRLRTLRLTLVCLLLASGFSARAANTNSLVWHKAADRVDADIRGEALWPLLEQIAAAADWKVFVEPGAEHNASAKFKDLPSGDALKMLLGNLNFALVPQTNAPALLYVFRTTMKNATKQVHTAKPVRRVANELLIRVKPGTDIDALAKSVGAKITAWTSSGFTACNLAMLRRPMPRSRNCRATATCPPWITIIFWIRRHRRCRFLPRPFRRFH